MTTVNPRTRGLDPSEVRAEQRWRLDAACAGYDTSWFFPEDEDSAAEAKALCAGCPVRDACLDYAMAHREDEGIWGGLTGSERRRMRRRRRDAARRATAA